MRLWFRIVVSILSLTLLGITFWFYFADRRAVGERIEHEAVLMSRALSRQAAGLMSVTNMLKFDMIRSVGDLARGTARLDSEEAIWRDRLRPIPGVDSICAFDRSGRMIIGTSGDCRRAPQLGWFQPFPAIGTEIDQIGRPFQMKTGSDWLIPTIETWTNEVGEPQGMIVVVLRSSYLSDVYSNYDTTGRSGIALYRSDGILLARFPQVDDRIGLSYANTDIFRPALSQLAGRISGRSAIDGIERIWAFNRVPGTALIIVVGLDTSAVPGWSAATLVSFGALALLIGCVLFVSRQLDRHLTTNFDTRQEMTLQARTDALTGLPNRRAFDEALAREWNTAAANGTSLSMLLLDVDQFKAFNDTYGHLPGDNCLRRVAITLQQGTFETIGHLARYGGEEFALLLIDVTPSVALLVANHLRVNVQALQMRHTGNKGYGVVTVSIGVATYDFQDGATGMTPAELIELADEALYRAKDGGRNRVEEFRPTRADDAATELMALQA